MGERNLAGLRHRAAAHQARVGDRMMRRTKWASGDDRLSVESTDNAMNLGGLERLGKGQIRKDRRQSLRQHCLSWSWRADENDIVSACRRDFQSAFDMLLAFDVIEISIVLRMLVKEILEVDRGPLNGLGAV